MYCSVAEIPWPTHFFLQIYENVLVYFGTDPNKCDVVFAIDEHCDAQMILHTLTQCTSSVPSTLGSMRAGGSTSACRMTWRSSSARPLDTELTRTHFSVRPRSSSASMAAMVSRAADCKHTHTVFYVNNRCIVVDLYHG